MNIAHKPCHVCGAPVSVSWDYCSARCANEQAARDKAENEPGFREIPPRIFWTAAVVMLVVTALGMLNQ